MIHYNELIKKSEIILNTLADEYYKNINKDK